MTSNRHGVSTDVDYREELACAIAAAHEAGQTIASSFRDGVESWEKSEDDPVTQADLDADALIRDVLGRAYPADGLLSEESADDLSRLDRARTWIVDPIDGTREFTRQIPEFAVSIGLAVSGRPVLGVVHNPVANVTVAGCLGHGVRKNGVLVRVSACTELRRARVAASRSETRDGRLEAYGALFGEVVPTGSIAWKLALVACGDFDFNLSVKPKSEWDVCAGDFLVHEAGGRYVDFRGERVAYNARDTEHESSMAAGPVALIDEFMAKRPKPEPRFD